MACLWLVCGVIVIVAANWYCVVIKCNYAVVLDASIQSSQGRSYDYNLAPLLNKSSPWPQLDKIMIPERFRSLKGLSTSSLMS